MNFTAEQKSQLAKLMATENLTSNTKRFQQHDLTHKIVCYISQYGKI